MAQTFADADQLLIAINALDVAQVMGVPVNPLLNR
jgi:hypothetical protein